MIGQPAGTEAEPKGQAPVESGGTGGATAAPEQSRSARFESGPEAVTELRAGDPVRVLYIAGIGRSGSTLLARALGEVDGFVAAGEVMHFFGRGLVNDE